jgi:enoyl-CoA hydratase/carnithine racemase
MNSVTIEMHDAVAEVQMRNGITNAINLDLVVELSNAISQLSKNDQVNGVVLTSSNDKFFSIGFDIPTLIELSEKDFKVFYRTFNKFCLELYTFTKPTLAAITGHAIAGGCILALCCDYRFIARGHKLMGLNEIKLGVPVPYLADRILQEIVGGKNARVIMETGDFYKPEESLALGLVDQVEEAEEVVNRGIEKIRSIEALPLQIYTAIKRNRVEPVTERLERVLEKKMDEFIEYWFSPEARERLEEAKKKFEK